MKDFKEIGGRIFTMQYWVDGKFSCLVSIQTEGKRVLEETKERMKRSLIEHHLKRNQ